MATGKDVLETAMQDIGVLGSGVSSSPDEQAYGLKKINNILGSWSYQELLIPYKVKESKSISISTDSIDIGVGATWNTARPIEVLSLWWGNASAFHERVKLISSDKYAGLEAKGVATGRPLRMYYEPVDSADITRGVLYFDKTTAAAEALHMISLKELSELSLITSTINLPPPWIDALTKTLAIDIAGKFGAKLKDSHAVVAKISLDNITNLVSKHRKTQAEMDTQAVAEVMS